MLDLLENQPLFPELPLPASAAFYSGTLDLLFQNWVVTLGVEPGR